MPEPKPGERVPLELAEAHVVDGRGVSVRLSTFWVRGPCAIVWLRHYGCVGCSEQLTDLTPRLEDLARAGVHTLLVGNGTREQRDGFVERTALEHAAVEVVTDPALATYGAAGLVRSTWATVGPRALWEMARAMGAGHPHRRPEGDRLQQGGSMVVDARGSVVLFKRNHSIGDHASASDLVEAALRVAIARQGIVV